MFKLKVGIALAIVFAVCGFVAHKQIASNRQQMADDQVSSSVERDQKTLTRLWALSAYALVEQAREIANSPDVRDLLSKTPKDYAQGKVVPDEDDFRYEVHRGMNTIVKKWHERFIAQFNGGEIEESSRSLSNYLSASPDLFIILDKTGVPVSDASDPARFGAGYKGTEDNYPKAKAKLLLGSAFYDIWIHKGFPMLVGLAPVIGQYGVVGSVVLGFRLMEAEIKHLREPLSSEVAYFIEDTPPVGTMSAEVIKVLQDEISQSKSLGADLYSVRNIRHGDQNWAIRFLPISAESMSAYAAVWMDLTLARSEATSDLSIIYILALIGFLLAFAAVFIFFDRFLKPFYEIDRGVLELINGDGDYWFKAGVSGLPNTLSQNLNVLVCQLSGRPLPDDDEHASSAQWSEVGLFDTGTPALLERRLIVNGESSGYQAEVIALATQDDENYARDLFRNYTTAMRAQRLPIQGITNARFTELCTAHTKDVLLLYPNYDVRYLVQQDPRIGVQLKTVLLK